MSGPFGTATRASSPQKAAALSAFRLVEDTCAHDRSVLSSASVSLVPGVLFWQPGMLSDATTHAILRIDTSTREWARRRARPGGARNPSLVPRLVPHRYRS